MFKCCYALSDESVWAIMVLRSWAASKGIVPKEKILDVLQKKSKRTKKVARARTNTAADIVIGATVADINSDQDE